MEDTCSVSETLFFLVSSLSDDGQSPKSPVILSVIRQDPLESTYFKHFSKLLNLHVMKYSLRRNKVGPVLLCSVIPVG